MTKDGDGKVGLWPVPGYAYYQSDPAADIELWRCVAPQYAPPLVSLAIYLQSARGSGEGGAADPNPYQFRLARHTLTAAGESTPDDAAVDRLARELVRHLVLALDGLGLSGDAGGWEAAWQRVMTEQRAELRKEILAELESQGRGAAAVESKAVARGVRIDYQRVEARLCVAAGTEAPDGDMLALSAKAADFLASIGRDGAEQAEEMRTAARKQWAAWCEYRKKNNPASWFDAWQSDPAVCPDLLRPFRLKEQAELIAYVEGRSPWFPECKYLLALARAVWLDLVRPVVNAERKAAVMPMPVVRPLVEVCGRVDVCGGNIIANGRTVATVPDAERTILALRYGFAGADGAVLDHLLQERMDALRTLPAQRLLRWLVNCGTAEWARCGGRGNNVTLRPPGGYEGLRRATGCGSPKDNTALRLALEALASIEIPTSDDGLRQTRLLVPLDVDPGGGDRKGALSILVNWPLLPCAGYMMKTDKRLLVPVPAVLPALYGRHNEHWRQAALQLRMMLHFADRSNELRHGGGIVLTEKNWEDLANASGVATERLPDIRRAYYPGGPSLFPTLKWADARQRKSTLADDRARELLEGQGAIRRKSAARGGKGKGKKSGQNDTP